MQVDHSHHDVRIRQISDPVSVQLKDLVEESKSEGFQFLRKLVDDWNSGENRFSQPGEALFVAEYNGHFVGVCGLNVDPYVNSPTVGRVRRFYVSAKFRRQKIGSRLIDVIICLARDRFTILRLYTSSPDAARFYVAVGFGAHDDPPDCTHILQLK